MAHKWKDLKKKFSPEVQTRIDAEVQETAKKFKGLKYVDPADIDDEAALLPCMEGDATQALWRDSITGQCEECGKTIHWAASAPARSTKMCRGCAYEEIKGQGDKAPESISCSDTTIDEFCQHFGMQDTPEVRQMIAEMAKQRYMEWLREGIDK